MMQATNSIVVCLSISAQDYQLRYRQPGTQVQARAVDGRRVQLPASLLQRFVDYSGVHGCFQIYFDPESGRCLSIERQSRR